MKGRGRYLLMTARYKELDGLRGVAALAVFISHAIKMIHYKPDDAAYLIADRIGVAAVDLFFVLSGFCLILPYIDNNRPVDVINFVIRRILRIYPVYLVVIVISVISRNYIFSGEQITGLTGWFNSFWTTEISVMEVINHLFLITGGYRTGIIDPVIWTLIIEMKASLILPFVFPFIKKYSFQYHAVYIILIGIIGTQAKLFGFFSLFLLGGILARYRHPVTSLFRNYGAKLLAVSIAVVLFILQFVMPVFDRWQTHYMLGLTAVIIISLVLANKGTSFFCGPVATLLGEISYPLYLVHLPVMITVASLIFPATSSAFLVWGLTFFITVLYSMAIHICIEKPFISVGRKLTTRTHFSLPA